MPSQVTYYQLYFKVMDNFVTPLQTSQNVSEPITIEGPVSQTGDVALDTLMNVFAYDHFCGKQRDAVNAILNKKDCIVLVPAQLVV